MLKQISRFLGCVTIASLALVSCQPKQEKADTEIISQDTIKHTYYLDIIIDSLKQEQYKIKSGDNLGYILGNCGVTAKQVESLVAKSDSIFDITKIKAGANYRIIKDIKTDSATHFVYERSKIDHVIFDLRDSMNVYTYTKPITLKTSQAEGTINSSLWNTIYQSGHDIMLSDLMAEIYAWQIDFFGIAKGDNYKVIYDQAYIDDTTKVYIDNVKGAVFTHHGETFYAIPFQQDSIVEFFDEKGQSLRKAFLKAPLKYSRISSGFSNARRHPILKIVRPHHGVDYAAPTGTPVRTIGDGIVTHKAFQAGGAGYYLKIKHNANYVTTYMHLSKYAKGLQVGQRVKQGEIIAYVGSTGGSTGPHLDFRVHFNGQPINPLKMKSPPSIPVKPENLDTFEIVKQEVIKQLMAIDMPKETVEIDSLNTAQSQNTTEQCTSEI